MSDNRDEEKIVVFGKYDNAVDANIVKGVLETNGIVAGVVGDSTANALLLTPIYVVVFERDLERARAIIDSPAEEAAGEPEE